MVVRLKDGTQEYISSVEKLVDIVENRLGSEFKVALIEFMDKDATEDLKRRYNEIVDSIEEMYHNYDKEI